MISLLINTLSIIHILYGCNLQIYLTSNQTVSNYILYIFHYTLKITCFTTFLCKVLSTEPKEGKHIKDGLSIIFFKIKNIYVSIKLMSNMVHDKYVQQRGTCTHIASKCHKYFTDSIKKVYSIKY